MATQHVLKVSTGGAPYHAIYVLCPLSTVELAWSEPKVVFCKRAQEECLVGRDLYDGGEDGAVKVLLRRGIEAIYLTFTLTE